MCENFSFSHICKSCQELFLQPSIYKRTLLHNVEVISFYKYKDIKKLLHTKHTDLGYYIYTILAKNSFEIFAKNFNYQEHIAAIPIDDTAEHGYSHTAILTKHLQTKKITPRYNTLRAKNKVSYSGRSKDFRAKNPREFALKNFHESALILVDDIITTGSTLNEALRVMQKNDKEILCCLTLADASLK